MTEGSLGSGRRWCKHEVSSLVCICEDCFCSLCFTIKMPICAHCKLLQLCHVCYLNDVLKFLYEFLWNDFVLKFLELIGIIIKFHFLELYLLQLQLRILHTDASICRVFVIFTVVVIAIFFVQCV